MVLNSSTIISTPPIEMSSPLAENSSEFYLPNVPSPLIWLTPQMEKVDKNFLAYVKKYSELQTTCQTELRAIDPTLIGEERVKGGKCTWSNFLIYIVKNIEYSLNRHFKKEEIEMWQNRQEATKQKIASLTQTNEKAELLSKEITKICEEKNEEMQKACRLIEIETNKILSSISSLYKDISSLYQEKLLPGKISPMLYRTRNYQRLMLSKIEKRKDTLASITRKIAAYQQSLITLEQRKKEITEKISSEFDKILKKKKLEIKELNNKEFTGIIFDPLPDAEKKLEDTNKSLKTTTKCPSFPSFTSREIQKVATSLQRHIVTLQSQLMREENRIKHPYRKRFL